MRADLLHVVTCIANPIRWASRIALFQRFAAHVVGSGAQLTVVECAYGDRPFACAAMAGANHVGVRAKTLLWVKENLLNIGIARLPQDWKYLAWIDADITFRNPDWAAETVQALQLYDIVQPWSDCYDLGPGDEHLQAYRSFCRQFVDGRPLGADGYPFAHPGYAWAATRQALDHVGGLIDTAALGAADHHMALALAGRVRESVPGGISDGYLRPLLHWQGRAQQHIGGNVGYVPGTIEHSWHGAKVRRAYVDRWNILVRNQFDPALDLKRNVWGVWELAGNKPRLRREIDLYFRDRNEDANML